MRRREFLSLAAAPAFVGSSSAQTARKKIAAISSTYFVRSHADDIDTRFLEGYWLGDTFHPSPCEIVSLYLDQTHPADVGHRLSAAFGFPIVPTIEDALTRGTGKLAVDGVLIVCEHGDYPFNDKMQQLYPRYEFFERVVKVFRASGRSVPVYTDKHLSYDWTKAKQMYDWSRELKFPLMAGSSVSVTFRRPELDYPLGVELEDALAVSSSWVTDGGVIHNMEMMQSLVERRKGGETGVRAVQYIVGDAVWKAAADGIWSKELMRAALSRGLKIGPGAPEDVKNPVLCVVEYNDGFRGCILNLPGLVSEYLVAVKVKGKKEPDATLCYVPTENSNNFSSLTHAIAHMFITGKHLYPVERTLLTTGVDSFLMESAAQGHKRIETPMLNVAYKAPKQSYYAHGAGS